MSTERPSYGSLLEDVKLCVELSYHSVWISDHVLGMYEEPNASRFECWTTSSAPLAQTRRIMFGATCRVHTASCRHLRTDLEQITRYINANVSLFIIRFMGEDSRHEAEIFAGEVVSNF